MATGQPNSSPKAMTWSPSVSTVLSPGTPSTPAFSAAIRELILSPMTSMASGGGPMNADAAVGDGPGEVGVLGEEPVAGVHAVGAAALDGVEDRLGVQVALGGGLAAEGVGLVGQAHVQGVAVEVGVHGDGARRPARGRCG